MLTDNIITEPKASIIIYLNYFLIYIYIYIYFCLIRIIENKQKLDSWKWTLNANITNDCFLKYLYYIKNDEKKVNPPPFKIFPFLVSPILTRSSKSPPCQTSENPVTPPLLGEGVQTLYLLPCNICHDFSKSPENSLSLNSKKINKVSISLTEMIRSFENRAMLWQKRSTKEKRLSTHDESDNQIDWNCLASPTGSAEYENIFHLILDTRFLLTTA